MTPSRRYRYELTCSFPRREQEQEVALLDWSLDRIGDDHVTAVDVNRRESGDETVVTVGVSIHPSERDTSGDISHEPLRASLERLVDSLDVGSYRLDRTPVTTTC